MEKVNKYTEKIRTENEELAQSLLKMKEKLSESMMENKVYFVNEIKKQTPRSVAVQCDLTYE